MRTSASIEDLAFAADWLRAYEPEGVADGGTAGDNPDTDDESARALLRVAAWVDAEIARRAEDADVREVVRRTGVTPTRARAALRTIQSRTTE